MASPTEKLALVVLLALGIPLPAQGQATGACAGQDPPPGARSLGYLHKVFCIAPTTADIADSGSSASLYSGNWYSKNPAPLSLYSMSGGVLAIANGGGVMTETRQSTPGLLPLLPASAGFYVEFAELLSDNDRDHWPAAWLMPQEHDLHHTDHLASDPAGYERWMELDADEGGFNGGHHGAVINWWGHFPQYEHKNYGNDPASTFGMDRTQEHIFGLSYDPNRKKVTWWVDGVSVGSASTQDVPAIVNSYHYYLIVGNQNHGANHPYTLYVPYFSAWSP